METEPSEADIDQQPLKPSAQVGRLSAMGSLFFYGQNARHAQLTENAQGMLGHSQNPKDKHLAPNAEQP